MKVSIILTSYNHGKYIKQAIDSILAQTYKDFELIIYDDCSLDDSLQIISSYEDDRIRVIASSYNRGYGITKYVISNYVKSEYVAIAHSDDFWEKDKLEKQMAFIENNGKVSAVFSLVRVVDEDGNEYENGSGFYYDVFNVENRNRYEWLRNFFYKGNCLCHPSVLIRTESYEKYKLFVVGLRQIPDFYMWIRLCLNSDIYILQEKLSCFRVRKNEQNTSGFRKDTSVRSATEWKLILEQFLELQEYDDFISVFPEAKEYAKPERFICEYAFARICLQDNIPNYKKAYGLELLYKLLNDKEKAGILQDEYGFTVKEFFALTGRYDLYGLYPNALEELLSIYLDMGSGYSEENVLRYSYEYWQEHQTVEAKFDIDKEKYQNIRKMRIDPLENKFIKCKLEHFMVNGVERKVEPINAFQKDGMDVFLTHDPSYEYVNEEDIVCQVCVRFQICQASCEEISQEYTRRQLEMQYALEQKSWEIRENKRCDKKEKQMLKEIYAQRKSFWELSKNDFKSKYTNSLLGAVWAFLMPMVMILVLWFIFEIGLRTAPVENIPFMLFYIPAYISWNFFSEAFSSACGCLREYSYVVKKMNFKIELLPVIKILSSFYVHVFFIGVVFIIFGLYGWKPSIYNIQIIYYVFCLLVLILGLSFLFCSLAAFSGDVNNVVAVILQVGFWATPIVWVSDTMPMSVQYVLMLNPMFYICNGYRETFLYHRWFWENPVLTAYFWGVTVIILVLGLYTFKRLRPQFSDVL